MEVKYPELKDRIQSIFIDTIFIVLLVFIASNILEKFPNVPDWVRMFLFVLLFIAYEPLLICIGCTVGNYVKGIRVRKEDDENKRINFLQSIIRYAFKLLLGWISFLTIHSNTKKRAIHDFVSGSVMIKYKYLLLILVLH